MMVYKKHFFKDYDPQIRDWDPPTIRRFDGKDVIGRYTKGFGSSVFMYAGKKYRPQDWTTPMSVIKSAAEALVYGCTDKKVNFTFCLCGLYQNGSVSIPHHSDTVPTLDDIVVSISFGSTRLFEWYEYDQDIKSRSDTSKTCVQELKPVQIRRFLLEDGDAFIFDGHSQMRSTHAVPPLEQSSGERVNLTFRTGL